MAPASPPLPPPQQIISRFSFCIYLVPGAYKLVEVVRHLVRMKTFFYRKIKVVR